MEVHMSKSKTRRPRTLAAEPERSPQHPRDGSKQALLVELLNRPEGASLEDLLGATGWLPHTTRAALTGIRRRGYEIARGTADDGQSRYRVTAPKPDTAPRRRRTGRRRGSAKPVAQASQ